MQKTVQKGVVISSAEGKKFNLLGHAITAFLTKDTTGGSYYVFEVVTPPGLGLPPHVHDREDELIYVLEGEFEIMLGDKNFVAKAGDKIFFPKHVPHAFHNGSSKAARGIFTAVPGDSFEEFFEKLSALPVSGEPDMKRIVEIFAEHGMKVLIPENA